MLALGFVALVVLVLAVVAAFNRRLYQFEHQGAQGLAVTTADGWRLQVWHHAAVLRRFKEPVILCHGLANNAAIFDFVAPQNLARWLADCGFETYVVEHRGDARSEAPFWPVEVSFDDVVKFDVPALVAAVGAHAGSTRVLWVGHSLGGLLGLAAVPLCKGVHIAALCTIGSPMFFRLHHRVAWLLRVGQWFAPTGSVPIDWLAQWAAPMAGRFSVPAANASANFDNLAPGHQRVLLSHGIEPLWRGILSQLEDWVRNDVFRSLDQMTDYRAAAVNLKLPMLIVAGSVDGLAPPEATAAHFAAMTTPEKTYALFGRAQGYSADYGHGDLIIGLQAHREVYPVISKWLADFATPA